MKNKNTLLIIILITLLAACKSEVPEVPHVNPHNIVINDIKITQAAFLEEFCINVTGNEDCEKVRLAMAQDATKGTLPKGW